MTCGRVPILPFAGYFWEQGPPLILWLTWQATDPSSFGPVQLVWSWTPSNCADVGVCRWREVPEKPTPSSCFTKFATPLPLLYFAGACLVVVRHYVNLAAVPINDDPATVSYGMEWNAAVSWLGPATNQSVGINLMRSLGQQRTWMAQKLNYHKRRPVKYN